MKCFAVFKQTNVLYTYKQVHTRVNRAADSTSVKSTAVYARAFTCARGFNIEHNYLKIQARNAPKTYPAPATRNPAATMVPVISKKMKRLR